MTLLFQHFTFDALSKDLLYQIMRLRQEVFIVEQNCPYLDADGKDQDSYHLIGLNPDGEVLAYTRILPKGISYPEYCSIGRVVTSEKARGIGAGKEVMLHSIALCKEKFPEQKIKISAQSYLDKFYTELGFQYTGDSYLEDNIPHQAMIYTEK